MQILIVFSVVLITPNEYNLEFKNEQRTRMVEDVRMASTLSTSFHIQNTYLIHIITNQQQISI